MSRGAMTDAQRARFLLRFHWTRRYRGLGPGPGGVLFYDHAEHRQHIRIYLAALRHGL